MIVGKGGTQASTPLIFVGLLGLVFGLFGDGLWGGGWSGFGLGVDGVSFDYCCCGGASF